MATIEHTTQTLLPPRAEQPVFVATSDRRARILRRAGFAAAILAALWLAALGIGMLGLGRLPGVPLPPLGKLDRSKPAPKTERINPAILADANAVSARLRASGSATASRLERRTRPLASRFVKTVSPGRPAAKAPTVPATTPPASVPRPRQTGWARRGLTAPPGKVRVTQPPLGQAKPLSKGQAKKVATTPPPPPPVPPGQQMPPKKA